MTRFDKERFTQRLSETSLQRIINEYTPDTFQDDDNTFQLKTIVENLNEVDKRVLILYADLHSLRNVAKVLDTTVYFVDSKLRDIRKKINNKLK